MKKPFASVASRFFVLAAVWGYLWSVSMLQKHPPEIKIDTLRVVLPAVVQTLMAGGDQYLAANIGIFRAMTLTTDSVDMDTIHTLAKIQQEAAYLSPWSEDNYYIAQAVLPWQGEVQATIHIMQRASEYRNWDAIAAFFWGFDLYYFEQDIALASHILLDIACSRSDAINCLGLTAIAAKWRERSQDPIQAKNLLIAMQKQSRDAGLKKLLGARILRLDGLIALRAAAADYQRHKGKRPQHLIQLVEAGFISVIPADPLGKGYRLDALGTPQLIYDTPMGSR